MTKKTGNRKSKEPEFGGDEMGRNTGIIIGIFIGIFIGLFVFPIEAIQLFDRIAPAFVLIGILTIISFVLMVVLDSTGANNRLISFAFGLAIGFLISIFVTFALIYHLGLRYDSSESWFKQVIG